MAEFHNFSDLRAQSILERELLDVRNELRRAAGYDPTMSLAENVKMYLDCARLLGDLHRNLTKQYNELKKEHENDKEVARSYPLAGDSGFCRVVVPQTVRVNAWFGPDGVPSSDPFDSYFPSGEFVPGNLLGSTDGYGR